MVVPLVFILLATVILFSMEHKDVAWMVSYLGTPLVMVANLVYIVFFHSRNRWKGANWVTRYVNVITFRR